MILTTAFDSAHSPVQMLNATFDRIVRPVFVVRGRILPAWHVFAALAIVAGTVVFAAAGTYLQLRWPEVATVVAVNLATVAVPLLIARRLSAAPELVLLRSMLLALAATTATAIWRHAPVLDTLDAWVPGMAMFLAFGRVGCLISGCCHGKPSAFGVCYRWRVPAESGTSERLEPVQAYESFLFFALAAWSLMELVNRHQPGKTLILFLGIYGISRYGLEFRRGDRRPYLWRLSEAQWLSLACVFGSLAAAYALEPKPGHWWRVSLSASVTALVLLTAGGVLLPRRRSLSFRSNAARPDRP